MQPEIKQTSISNPFPPPFINPSVPPDDPEKKHPKKPVVAISGPVQGHKGQELFPSNVTLLCRPCKLPIAPRGGWHIAFDLKRRTIRARFIKLE